MAWRIAKSLDKLRSQVNAEYPGRNKSSDGTIGDEKHASRSSDHNPWVKDGKTGVVTGMDVTNDPDNGPVSDDLAENLKDSRDPRIKYIISNAQICSGDAGPSPWVWRKYTGANAHRKHVHLSVKSEKQFYDSVKPWSIVAKVASFHEPVATIDEDENFRTEDEVPVDNTVNAQGINIQPQKAAYDVDVEILQQKLLKLNYNEIGDADGFWGGKTRGATTAFMNDRGQATDGTFTPAVSAELNKALAENWSRPIAPSRANATAKDIAPKVEAVRQSLWQRLGAKITGIGASVMAVASGLSDKFSGINDQLYPVKRIFADTPSWVWWSLAALFCAVAYFSASKIASATTKDYNTGKIN